VALPSSGDCHEGISTTTFAITTLRTRRFLCVPVTSDNNNWLVDYKFHMTKGNNFNYPQNMSLFWKWKLLLHEVNKSCQQILLPLLASKEYRWPRSTWCPTSWRKRRLVVEVESLASSWKKNYDASRWRRIGVVVEKMKEVDELSTKIRVIYLRTQKFGVRYTKQINNINKKTKLWKQNCRCRWCSYSPIA